MVQTYRCCSNIDISSFISSSDTCSFKVFVLENIGNLISVSAPEETEQTTNNTNDVIKNFIVTIEKCQ